MYVLDSVVKNVGTPYTLFLGRNLYDTFMNAYTLVDSSVRKKFDEMLKTWKEPVPGSMDPRPVFPAETTRRIENVLIKARTAALQQQQFTPVEQRTGTPPQNWRPTTATPQHAMSHQANQVYPQPHGVNGSGNGTPQYKAQTPQYHAPSQHPLYSPPPASSVDLVSLNRDIDNLILRARSDFAQSPLDQNIQTRLRALFDLQNILRTGRLTEAQLQEVVNQVSQLTGSTPQPRPTPPPQYSTPSMTTATYPPPQPTAQSASQPAVQPNLSALFNSPSLQGLLRATANRQQPTPPPPQSSALPASVSYPNARLPQIPNTPPVASSTPIPLAAENPLIAQLRASGILPAQTNTPPPPLSGLAQLLGGGAVSTPPTSSHNQSQNSGYFSIDVQLTSASLKM